MPDEPVTFEFDLFDDTRAIMIISRPLKWATFTEPQLRQMAASMLAQADLLAAKRV